MFGAARGSVAGGDPKSVCAELVEAPSFFPTPEKKERPFDKLRANGF
jgi:hypothetical protein